VLATVPCGPPDTTVSELTFSRDGSTIAFKTQSGVNVLHGANFSTLTEIELPIELTYNSASRISISRDGTVIAIGDRSYLPHGRIFVRYGNLWTSENFEAGI